MNRGAPWRQLCIVNLLSGASPCYKGWKANNMLRKLLFVLDESLGKKLEGRFEHKSLSGRK